jgi:ribose transport system permease protein
VAKDEARSKNTEETTPPKAGHSWLQGLRMRWTSRPPWSLLLADHAMLIALALLCLGWSIVTLEKQQPAGDRAASQLMAVLSGTLRPPASVLIVTEDREDDLRFSDALFACLQTAGYRVAARVRGSQATVHSALADLVANGAAIDGVATTVPYQTVVANIKSQFPSLDAAPIVVCQSTCVWPAFLGRENLKRLADQTAVFAVIAVGMTLVIMTGRIDLSVGGVAALSAATAATLIVRFGGPQASVTTTILASLAALALSGAVGTCSGLLITRLAIPSYLVTLIVMLIARGLASILTGDQSVDQLPQSFAWLGRGAQLLAIPNTLLLVAAICAIAHVTLTQSRFGGRLQTMGQQCQAAKPEGGHTARMLLVVYLVCGLLAGLAGLIEASQFKTAGPRLGEMYELYVIAAVVLGGTSLVGGRGRVLNSLIGVFVVAVIQNGMSLIRVESHTQKIVLGLLLLIAVVLGRDKR